MTWDLTNNLNWDLVLRNRYKAKFRIPVWTATKPDDADAIIQKALKVRGSSV